MKPIIPGIVGIVALTASTSCENGDALVVVRDSAGVQIVENAASETGIWRVDSVPLWDIGGSTTDSNYQFVDVTQVLPVGPGHWLVVDAGVPAMRAYDANGVFVQSVGRVGDGPGEFRALSGVHRRAPDSFSVFDARTNRVSVFDPGLAFVRSFGVPDRPEVATVADVFSMATEGWVIAGLPLPSFGPDWNGRTSVDLAAGPYLESQLDQLAPMFTIRGFEVFAYNTGGFPSTATPYFARRGLVVPCGMGYVVADTERWELRVFAAPDQLQRIVRLNHPVRAVTARDRAAVQSSPRHAALRDMTFPETMPALGRYDVHSRLPIVLCDTVDRIWVLRYHFPESSGERWDLIGSDGVVMARAHFPIRYTPFAVTDSVVTGMWRDNNDVHHVQQYRLQKPAKGAA